MKASYFIYVIFSLSLFIVSCDKEDNPELNLLDVTNLIVEHDPVLENKTLFSKTTGMKELVLQTKTSNDRFSHYVLLTDSVRYEGEVPINDIRGLSLKEYIIFKDGLILKNRKDKILTLICSRTPDCEEVYNKLLTNYKVEVVGGIGFSHQVNSNVNINAIDLSETSYFSIDQGDNPSGRTLARCDAGGSGSTSCSISQSGSSCSVSCSSGYYACCKYNFTGVSCSCINATTGGGHCVAWGCPYK